MLGFPVFFKVQGRRRDVIDAAAGAEYRDAALRLAAVRSRLCRSCATPAERAPAAEPLSGAGWIQRLRHGAEDETDALFASLPDDASAAEPAHEVDPCTP